MNDSFFRCHVDGFENGRKQLQRIVLLLLYHEVLHGSHESFHLRLHRSQQFLALGILADGFDGGFRNRHFWQRVGKGKRSVKEKGQG